MKTESEKRGLSIPWFDPGDAGVDSRVLILLESPGPMSDAAKGSGVISVDNADPTAENVWTFRRSAGLLDAAVHWNAVPWYIPGGEISDGDLTRGHGLLRGVLRLLPALTIVVPMGRVAQRAWSQYCVDKPNEIVTIPTWHPSQRGLLGPGRADHVQSALRRATWLVHN